ncbi:MAG: MBL fold metallo-hydrolase [Gammaproteobacteria bacterium]
MSQPLAHLSVEVSRPIELLPGVVRLTAPNPGVFTGPGTNTYLIGTEQILVIDPGPDLPEHTDAIVKAAAGNIQAIAVTHTHPDHSPGAAPLAAATGAEIWGMACMTPGNNAEGWRPDRTLKADELLRVGAQSIRVLHTPGHASNHLCFLLEAERMLITGDHIMQGSTVVISPPDGDMQQYLDSLRMLQHLELTYLAPGHGHVIDEPQTAISALIAHRLRREAKVVSRLRTLGQVSVDQLVASVYDDVDSRLHPIARHSLLAHLIKLQAERRVAEQQKELWEVL